MISTLRGTVTGHTPSGVVVEVGGVGLHAFTPQRSIGQLTIGEDTLLYTTLVVREDDLSLYGFATEVDRAMFDLLRSVNGVGPKSALGVLGEMTANDIAHAVATEDDRAFTAVSGIGPKTGKLIVVSLQGKMDHLAGSLPSDQRPVDSVLGLRDRRDIVGALVSLGWGEKVAGAALDDVMETVGDEVPDVTELIRRSLAILGPKTVQGGGS